MNDPNHFRQIDQEMQHVQNMVQETLLKAEIGAKIQQVQLLSRAIEEIQSLVLDNSKTPKKVLCETVYYIAENALIARDLVENDPTIFMGEETIDTSDYECPEGFHVPKSHDEH